MKQDDLFYTKTHEWVKWLDETTALVGITDHAQEELGDIVFVNLPQVDDRVTVGKPFGDIESVKAVSDLYSPVTGIVSKINEELMDAPEKINEDAYASWIIEVREISDKEAFLTAAQYESAFIQA